MKLTGKANVRNRFDIVCRDIVTGEVQKYQAHNIVLDSMWSRLVNFQTFFAAIHFGTGTGTLSPARTSLFTFAGAKNVTTADYVYALPTSYRMRQIVLNPEEYVGKELTEVGVAYGTDSTNLVTHAFIEDSEGNLISIVKTDTMVVTIYATIFFELGELTSMYGGQWRWVMPLENNQLLSYLMGASYPTQTFRVTAAPEFSTGTGPSHGTSANIYSWTKDAANKRATTPVRRLGIDIGNGEVRGFGLGSSDTLGTFRGQFPIPGVFAGHSIEGEAVGVGDGVETGFNLGWNDPQSLTLKTDGVAIAPEDYTLLPLKPGTNLFAFRPVQVLAGSAEDPDRLTLVGGSVFPVSLTPDDIIGVDTGASGGQVQAVKFRADVPSGTSQTLELRGSNNADFSGSVLVASLGTGTSSTWREVTFAPVQYRYYTVTISGSRDLYRLELISAADDQITFNTPPASGAVITADYTVPYIPKDSNHVLDLQCAIQWGEP